MLARKLMPVSSRLSIGELDDPRREPTPSLHSLETSAVAMLLLEFSSSHRTSHTSAILTSESCNIEPGRYSARFQSQHKLSFKQGLLVAVEKHVEVASVRAVQLTPIKKH